jgi:exo-1,4-beta-D-glucosaminidase
MAEYADFTGLDKLPMVKLETENSIVNTNGEYEVTVTLKNPGENIAFLVELGITGDKSGKSVVPIIWDDNYVSIVPGESKVIKARFHASSLNGEKPLFRYKGWNVK